MTATLPAQEWLLRARPGDPAWARPALLGLLVATGLLYLAGLSGHFPTEQAALKCLYMAIGAAYGRARHPG